jgi:ribosome-binding factor A
VGAHRRERVAHRIQAEVAELLLREARDPRLQTVTVTGVRVTADLRQARIYFRTLTPEATPREAQAALRRAAPFLRGALGRSLGLRVTPELRFEYDTTPDTARRLDALLDETHGARDHEDES